MGYRERGRKASELTLITGLEMKGWWIYDSHRSHISDSNALLDPLPQHIAISF